MVVNIPFGNISDPDRFGLGPGENVHITTRDGETLFGWLVKTLTTVNMMFAVFGERKGFVVRQTCVHVRK